MVFKKWIKLFLKPKDHGIKYVAEGRDIPCIKRYGICMPDFLALKNDWQMVASDFESVIRKIK